MSLCAKEESKVVFALFSPPFAVAQLSKRNNRIETIRTRKGGRMKTRSNIDSIVLSICLMFGREVEELQLKLDDDNKSG